MRILQEIHNCKGHFALIMSSSPFQFCLSKSVVDEAYKNLTFYAKCIYSAGDKPTPEEFIDHIARRVSVKSELEVKK